MALIDLDDFKSINDVYGHAAGDAVLAKVGHVLVEQLRTSDAIGRLGGDEFAILLPKCDAACGRTRLEAIDREINALTVSYGSARIPVRCSVGIVTFDRDDSPTSLMCRADAAMYGRKNQRNRNRYRLVHAAAQAS
jgi:diguanylate cyclase (GGDEF)-like protein